jgi:polysaccharide biosynthesis transport protein
MAKRAPASIQDYIEIVRWRRWWLVLPIVLISVATVFGSLFLPRSYRSEAIIIVEPQKVPSSYVQPNISVSVADRLQAIRQEILSRSRLRKIITEFNIYRSTKGNLATDDQVEMMRNDITVEMLNSQPGEHNKNVEALKITYSGSNPVLVQQVTRKLTSLFIEENLRDREQEAEGTTGFLDDQLEKMRQSLQEQEKKIQAFKSAHAGELPEQQMASLQLLGQLQGMLQTNSDAITRAQQQEKYLGSVLESISLIQTPQSMKSALQLQYDAKNAELISAEQRYRAHHPDVIRLGLELKALKEQVDAEKEASGKNGGSNVGNAGVTPEEINAQIGGLKDETAKRLARQTKLENDMQRIQTQISALPRVEQELAELTRDYETSRTSYEALLAKRNNSSIAAEMERRAEGEQFRILDPASLPEKPYRPNLLQIDLLGVFVGLFTGCGLALIVEMNDQTLHSEKDVAAIVAAPMLASVPWVLSSEESLSRRRQNWLVIGAVILAVVAIVVAGYCLRSSISSGFGWRF